MENFSQFATRTDQRWCALYNASIFLFFGIFWGIIIGLFIRKIIPVLVMFCIVLFCDLAIYRLLRRQKDIPLHFYGDQLLIFHHDGITYKIDDVPAWVFRFRQNALERKYNVGRIKIKGTRFYLYGVQDFDRTCRYIHKNFSEFE